MRAEIDRARLAELAVALLPGDETMPSATIADVHGSGMDSVFEIRPDLEPTLAAIIGDSHGTAAADFLRGLQQSSPADWNSLVLAVMSAYYFSDRVRALIGYSGPVPTTPLRPSDFERELLAPVQARDSPVRFSPAIETSTSKGETL